MFALIWLISTLSLDVVLCWSADFQHLAIYVNREYYENTLLPVTMNITVAWGWSVFVNNTLMTGGILYKLMLDNLCVCVKIPNLDVLGVALGPSAVYVTTSYRYRVTLESTTMLFVRSLSPLSSLGLGFSSTRSRHSLRLVISLYVLCASNCK